MSAKHPKRSRTLLLHVCGRSQACLAIFERVPTTMLSTHGPGPFTGENTLHVVSVNKHEKMARRCRHCCTLTASRAARACSFASFVCAARFVAPRCLTGMHIVVAGGMLARYMACEVLWWRAQVLMMVDLAFEHFDRKQLEQFYWAQAREHRLLRSPLLHAKFQAARSTPSPLAPQSPHRSDPHSFTPSSYHPATECPHPLITARRLAASFSISRCGTMAVRQSAT